MSTEPPELSTKVQTETENDGPLVMRGYFWQLYEKIQKYRGIDHDRSRTISQWPA